MLETESDFIEYFHPETLEDRGQDYSREEERVLRRVNQKVAASPTLDDLMDFVFDNTLDVLPCERLGIAFAEENGRRLVSRWNRATYQPLYLRNGYHQDLQFSTLEKVIRSGYIRVINDLERYYQYHPDSVSTQLLLREGIRSSMTCPLYVDGRPAGVFFRSSRRPFAYDTHQVRMHLAMAERLGQAVEKAWRIEQLTEANRAYTEMLGFVSHELKSPLASLVTDAQLLVDGYLGELNDKQAGKIRNMTGKANYLLGLIKDYLDLARIESGELKPELQNDLNYVADLIEPSLEIVQPQFDKKQMRVIHHSPENARPVEGDPQLLKIVLVNLLSNAAKYGREKGRVEISTTFSDSTLKTSVWNEGPGFSGEEKSRLFRKFSRLKKPELIREKGTGVGLYTCWRIIQAHQGKIVAEAEAGKWACFTFTLPQPIAREQ